MRFACITGMLVAALLILPGCNRDDSNEALPPASPTTVVTGTIGVTDAAGNSATTSGSTASTTGVASPSATEDGDDSSTILTTTTVAAGLPTYEVIHRVIEDGRETLVIVVEPGTYSNVQLENLVYDVVEQFSPSVAIVVDDRAVADLAILDERTEDEQLQLDSHTFLRIENGVEVTFFGPYASFPGLTVGS